MAHARRARFAALLIALASIATFAAAQMLASAAPPQPTNILVSQATGESGNVCGLGQVTWTIDAADSFEVVVGTSGSIVERASLGRRNREIVFVAPGTHEYTASVRACSAGQCSEWATASGTVQGCQPQPPPVITAPATSSTGTFRVIWWPPLIGQPSLGAEVVERYEIQRSSNGGQTWQDVDTNVPRLYFDVGQLPQPPLGSGTYIHRVRGCYPYSGLDKCTEYWQVETIVPQPVGQLSLVVRQSDDTPLIFAGPAGATVTANLPQGLAPATVGHIRFELLDHSGAVIRSVDDSSAPFAHRFVALGTPQPQGATGPHWSGGTFSARVTAFDRSASVINGTAATQSFEVRPNNSPTDSSIQLGTTARNQTLGWPDAHNDNTPDWTNRHIIARTGVLNSPALQISGFATDAQNESAGCESNPNCFSHANVPMITFAIGPAPGTPGQVFDLRDGLNPVFQPTNPVGNSTARYWTPAANTPIFTTAHVRDRMQFLHVRAVDRGGLPLHLLDGPNYLNYRAIAIIESVTPPSNSPFCGGPHNAPCVPSIRPTLSMNQIVEAERYDVHGAGHSYFERDEYIARPGHITNPRQDDVDLRECPLDASGQPLMSPLCVVGRIHYGEFLAYSISPPTGQRELLLCERGPQEVISEPWATASPAGEGRERKYVLTSRSWEVNWAGRAAGTEQQWTDRADGRGSAPVLPEGAHTSSNPAVATCLNRGGVPTIVPEGPWFGGEPPQRLIVRHLGGAAGLTSSLDFLAFVPVGTLQPATVRLDNPRELTESSAMPGDTLALTAYADSGTSVPFTQVTFWLARAEPNGQLYQIGSSSLSQGWAQADGIVPADLPTGRYYLYAQAESGVAAPVRSGHAFLNVGPAPELALTLSPATGPYAPSSSVTASVVVSGEPAASVQLWAGSQLLTNVTGAPVGPGPHTANFILPSQAGTSVHFRATASGMNGLGREVNRTIVVELPPPPAGLNLSFSPSQPTAPANITLSVTGSLTGVSRVDYLRVIGQSEALLGQSMTSAGGFAFTWPGVAAGTYQVRARGFNGSGIELAASVTSTITVAQSEIGPPPPSNDRVTAVGLPSVAPASDGVGATAGSFRVDESGAATYSIPILTAPGRGGVVPSLSLDYSSLGGDGPLGRGWQIGGTSAITRCRQSYEQRDVQGPFATEQGAPPLSFDESDRLCLDGQRLIEVAKTGSAGQCGDNCREYRTEIDAFTRVRSYDTDPQVAGPNYFVVQRKDGSTSWYGDRIEATGLPFMPANFASVLTPSAAIRRNRVVDTGTGFVSQVEPKGPYFLFGLSRTMDSVGNFVDYVYEGHASSHGLGELLLRKARFTGKTTLAGQAGSDEPPYAEVEFIYESAAAAGQQFGAGMRFDRTRRVSNIVSRAGQTVLRRYTPRYDQDAVSGVERLKSLQECVGSICYPKTRFDWVNTPSANSWLGGNAYNVGNRERLVSSRLGDVDGDGRLDHVWFRDVSSGSCPPGLPTATQRISVDFANPIQNAFHPNGFAFAGVPESAEACSWRRVTDNLSDAWALIDFNGDGLDDLMLADSSEPAATPDRFAQWHIYPARPRPPGGYTGPIWDQTENLLPACGAQGGARNEGRNPDCLPVPERQFGAGLAQLADFNGDGLVDVLHNEEVLAAGTSVHERLVVRMLQRVGNGFKFGPPREVALAWGPNDECSQSVNAISAFPDPLRRTELREFLGCFVRLRDSSNPAGRSPLPLDLNGDGRADLDLEVEAVYRIRERNDRGPGAATGALTLFPAPRIWSLVDRKEDRSALVQAYLNSAADFNQGLIRTEGWFRAAQLTAGEIRTSAQVGGVSCSSSVPCLVFSLYSSQSTGYQVYGQLEGNRRLVSSAWGDANGDGLLDLIRFDTRTQENLDDIGLWINTGQGLTGVLLAGHLNPRIERGARLRFADVNQDGRSDLIHVRNVNGLRYYVAYARPDGSFATNSDGVLISSYLGLQADSDTGNSRPIEYFADFNADGVVDFGSFLNRSGANTRGASMQGQGGPRHVIVRITNGLGARTDIQYHPMTNGGVYARAGGARNQVEGTNRGSPLHDILASSFVVSSVTSDAPTRQNPNERSTLHYRYSGARIQGGGRGPLGFRAITTIDGNHVNRHVVTRTMYYQEFPFVGMPIETIRYSVPGAYVPGNCLDPGWHSRAECFSAGRTDNPLSPSSAAFDQLPEGARLISFARNHPTSDRPQGPTQPTVPTPQYVYNEVSFEIAFDVDSAANGPLSETRTENGWPDSFGNHSMIETAMRAWAPGQPRPSITDLRNLARSLVGISAESYCSAPRTGVASGCEMRKRTTASFAAPDVDYWRLSRMNSSSVSHSRPDTPEIVRTSTFTYDLHPGGPRTGLLLSESVGAAGVNALKSVYRHDEFGNRVVTVQCPASIAEAQCLSTTNILQRPAGSGDQPLTSVHRYSRAEFAGLALPRGVLATASYAWHFDASVDSTQGRERVAQRVLATDVFGNPTRIADVNHVESSATYGPFGRQTGSSIADIGTASAVQYHWCQGHPSASGSTASQVMSCQGVPGAVYRVTNYVRGGATSVAYFDQLGRELATLAMTFNPSESTADDYRLVCSGFDGRSRPVWRSEPVFVDVALSDGLTPSIISGQCGEIGTATTHDEFDRVREIRLPDNTLSITGYAGLTSTTLVNLRRYAVGQSGSPTDRTHQQSETRDITGRVVSTVDATDGGTETGTTTIYRYNATDDLVEVRRHASGIPTLTGADIVNLISYDGLGRKLSQTDPDAGTLTYQYNIAGELICQRDARGAVTITDRDALGRVWRVRSDTGNCVATDIAVRLARDEDALGTLTTGSSRSVELTVYDEASGGLGQVARQLRRQTVGASFAHVDQLEQQFSYDALGRPVGTEIRLNPAGSLTSSEIYTTSRTYDEVGRVLVEQDVSGGRVENYWSAHGFLWRLRDDRNRTQIYWELQASDARGQVTRERRHGNSQLTAVRNYDARTGRVSAIRAGTWTGSELGSVVQDLGFQFDGQGTLLLRRDERTGIEERLGYDRLTRLTSTRLFGGSLPPVGVETLALTYDRLGNICTKKTAQDQQPRSYRYGPGSGCASPWASGSAHQLMSHQGPQGEIRYGYDAAGNQISADQLNGSLGDRTITYTAEGLAARIVAQAGSGAATTSEFRYGAGGRYLRIDQTGASTRTTRYLGSVEWITNSGSQRQELRRTIGGFLIISEERLSPGAPSTNRKHQYLFHDHLGSVDVIVEAESLANGNQGVVDRKSYNAHGERREVPGGTGPWQNLIDPRTQPTTNDARTDRGFTGHEHVDRAGIVHMNGRLYDPLTGRMLSADPIVQEPFNLQNLNRYSYVLNNPLSYTDPTGLSFVRKYWRQIVQIAAAVLTAGQSLWVTMATSFTVGVAVTGSLRGGLIAAFSAAVFHGIGGHFAEVAAANRAAVEGFTGVLGTGLKAAQFATQIGAHAMAGGVISLMQGGKFGHGFVSAGATKAASPWIKSIGAGARELAPARVATAALVGGTVSAATGGKFANGAVTAAFQQAWNGERGLRRDRRTVSELEQIRDLSQVERVALSRALSLYRKEIFSLSDEELLRRFPGAMSAAQTKHDAAEFARQAIRTHLIPLQAETVRIVMTEAYANAMDEMLSSVVVGPGIGLASRRLGAVYETVDTMEFAGSHGAIFGLFGSRPSVSVSCVLEAGCAAQIQRVR